MARQAIEKMTLFLVTAEHFDASRDYRTEQKSNSAVRCVLSPGTAKDLLPVALILAYKTYGGKDRYPEACPRDLPVLGSPP
jgi:hypothetical protein